MSEDRLAAMERENQEFLALERAAQLRGNPVDGQQCDTCRYYVGDFKKMAYCNHPRVQILVGADWWCQWWEAIPGADAALESEGVAVSEATAE